MDCPQCGSVMRERERSRVRIDFCPDCKGVWLDRGELDKIIAFESGSRDWDDDDDDGDRGRAQRSSGRRRDNDDDDDDDRRRFGMPGTSGKSKKRSFFDNFSEIFGGE